MCLGNCTKSFTQQRFIPIIPLPLYDTQLLLPSTAALSIYLSLFILWLCYFWLVLIVHFFNSPIPGSATFYPCQLYLMPTLGYGFTVSWPLRKFSTTQKIAHHSVSFGFFDLKFLRNGRNSVRKQFQCGSISNLFGRHEERL